MVADDVISFFPEQLAGIGHGKAQPGGLDQLVIIFAVAEGNDVLRGDVVPPGQLQGSDAFIGGPGHDLHIVGGGRFNGEPVQGFQIPAQGADPFRMGPVNDDAVDVEPSVFHVLLTVPDMHIADHQGSFVDDIAEVTHSESPAQGRMINGVEGKEGQRQSVVSGHVVDQFQFFDRDLIEANDLAALFDDCAVGADDLKPGRDQVTDFARRLIEPACGDGHDMAGVVELSDHLQIGGGELFVLIEQRPVQIKADQFSCGGIHSISSCQFFPLVYQRKLSSGNFTTGVTASNQYSIIGFRNHCFQEPLNSGADESRIN